RQDDRAADHVGDAVDVRDPGLTGRVVGGEAGPGGGRLPVAPGVVAAHRLADAEALGLLGGEVGLGRDDVDLDLRRPRRQRLPDAVGAVLGAARDALLGRDDDRRAALHLEAGVLRL